MFDPHRLMAISSTLQQEIGHHAPNTIKQAGYKKLLPWSQQIDINDPYNPLMGVEIEAERLNKDFETGSDHYPTLNGVWFHKEDGSLRNNGREFCTWPLPLGAYPRAFELLSQVIPEAQFSHRCSVHVHIDCRILTRAQLLSFCLLYAVFEPLFFAIAGRHRRTNNFCVGLEFTNDLDNIIDTVVHRTMALNLRKYAAFNILPMFPNEDVPLYGTVEFRHLYGTMDQSILMTWLTLIQKLRVAVLDLPLTWVIERTRRLNIDSSYLGLVDRVFQEHGEVFWRFTNLTKLGALLERNVSLVKQSVIHNDFSHRLKTLNSVYPESSFAKTAKRLYPNNFKRAGTQSSISAVPMTFPNTENGLTWATVLDLGPASIPVSPQSFPTWDAVSTIMSIEEDVT